MKRVTVGSLLIVILVLAIVARPTTGQSNTDDRVSALETRVSALETTVASNMANPTQSAATTANTQEFSGTGDTVVDVQLNAGLLRYVGTHDGARNFAVQLFGSDGSVYLLFNEIGPYSGEQAQQIDTGGAYTMAVTADGNWTVTLTQ